MHANEEQKHLVSVIVPIYKVEKYLPRCINSILTQSYENLEVILVDDGSPDNCGKICDSFAMQDSRIKVLHQKNGGLSNARNSGKKIATGDFIAFIDSDDYIHQDMISTLVASLLEDRVDIAICNVEEFWDTGEYKPFRAIQKKQVVDGTHAIKNVFTGISMIAVMNRLYRAEILQDIDFLDGRLYEDVVFDADVFLNTKCRVSFLPFVGYYYFRRSDSIMGVTQNQCPKIDLIHSYEYLYKKLEQTKTMQMYAELMRRTLNYMLSFEMDSKCDIPSDFSVLSRRLVRRYIRFILMGNDPLKHKLKICVLLYCPNIFRKVLKK